MSFLLSSCKKLRFYIYKEDGNDWSINNRFILGKYVDDRFRIIDIEDRYECFEGTNPGIFEDGNTVKMLNSDGVDMYVWY